MEYIITIILLVGLSFIQNELRQIFYQVRAAREHTHEINLQLISVNNYINKIA